MNTSKLSSITILDYVAVSCLFIGAIIFYVVVVCLDMK